MLIAKPRNQRTEHRSTRRSIALGLAALGACAAAGAFVATRWIGPQTKPATPPAAPAVVAPTATVPPPSAARSGVITYRADLGLTGVFASACPTAPVGVRWRCPTGGTPTGGLVWDGARFLVGLAEGVVVAIDPEGHEVWRRGAALDGIAAPLLVNGTRCYAVSPEGVFAAFDTTDGTLLWRITAPLDFAPRTAPVLVDGLLIALSQADGRLLALNPADGATRWVGEPTARSDGPLSAASPLVFFGNCDANLQFHSADSGALHAAIPLGQDAQIAAGVAVRGGRACCGTRNGDVVLFDIASATPLWRSSVGGAEVFSAPVLTDELVVVTTATAEVVALSAVDGHERWRHATGLRSATSPILVGDYVVLAAAGMVMALSSTTGQPTWSLSVGDATTEPCAGAGLIVVGTDEGDIVAVGPAR